MLNELNEIQNNNIKEENQNNNGIINLADSLEDILNINDLDNNKNIKVFVRFRPPNEIELSYSTNNSLILLSEEKLIFTQEKNLEIKKEYIFDGLFDINSQKDIFYKKTCKSIISNFIKGYNGAIICYGETGSGKTYTINEILPSITNQIFDYINETNSENDLFKIEISSFEINKDKINDLLNQNNKNLNIIQNEIDKLSNINISSSEQMNSLLNELISYRINQKEIKSHFIIRISMNHYIKQKNNLIISKLFLVDLEGSELLSNNKSLFSLNMIINNLSSNNNNIIYRDNKLINILKECFGGNCYTNIILTCSKHEKSAIETKNTLNFGEKIKKIENKPIINIINDFNEINKNKLILFDIIEDENENIRESINNNKINDEDTGDKYSSKNSYKFSEYQINQLNKIINQDKILIEQLNNKNNILESEKKNLIKEIENLIKEKKEENKKDTINNEYIENNINDLHEILNEKEEIINNKNKEIIKIKEEQNNQMKNFQELIECLEQDSNKIENKDNKKKNY